MRHSRKNDELKSDIGYHDYLALLCYTDAEWTRRKPHRIKNKRKTAFYNNFIHITDQCMQFRNGINKNHTDFLKTAKYVVPEEQKEMDHDVSSYLYNPLCYVPFGHADELSIVLLDDFDPVHHVTTNIHTTMEEACIGFCPKMEHIIPNMGNGLFSEFHSLFGQSSIIKEPTLVDGKYTPAAHDLLTDTPLLIFTKYKLHGLGVLGEGLLFQHTLFQTMASRCLDIKCRLLGEVKKNGKWHEWADEEDVNTTKISFLDLQGSEEIGSMIFCRNYSVAMAFVVAMRNLTFGDVFSTDKEGYLKAALGRSGMHKSVIKNASKLQKTKRSDDITELSDEHSFRWSVSSLSFSAISFIEEDYLNYKGYVEGHAKAKVSPGHLINYGETIVMDSKSKKKEPPTDNKLYQAVYGCVTGEDDAVFRYGTSPNTLEHPLIPLYALIKVFKQNYNRFGLGREQNNRDAIDISTTVTIPLLPLSISAGKTEPDFIQTRRGDNHFSPLLILLREVQERLFNLSHKTKTSKNRGKLNLLELKTKHRLYGLSMSLRRTIQYLYQNFSVTIGDPASFDAVIDLYDTFATLHVVLTKLLPDKLKNDGEPRRCGDDILILEEGRIEQIAMLVDAIHNSLSHKLQNIYAECQMRDMAIDFRGGLNQILFAVDAPVKCGLGLMRRYVIPNSDRNYDKVGVLTRVSFKPDVRCCSLRLGIEDKAQLAFYEVDVPHILHVTSYCDYLHEAFHLIFDALYLNKSFDSLGKISSVMRGRLSEIFTMLLSQILVFGSDTEASKYYLVASYSKSLTSIGWNDEETIVRFSELLIRLFIVVDAIDSSKSRDDIEKDPIKWSGQEWHDTNGQDREALTRFKDLLTKAGPFFSEYNRLWKEEDRFLDGQAFCLDQFGDIYPEMQKAMPVIWSEVLKLFQKYVKDRRWSELTGYQCTDDELSDIVEPSIYNGYPLIRGKYNNAGRNLTDSTNTELDSLFLICKIFRSYIGKIKQAKKKEVHIHRDKDRHVEFPVSQKEEGWFPFLLDRGVSSMFCPVPSERRCRLQRQIATIKSLWDISSSLRAKRFESILEDNFGTSKATS